MIKNRWLFLLLALSSSLAKSEPHDQSQRSPEKTISAALDIQNSMIAGAYDQGDDCSPKYALDKAKINAAIGELGALLNKTAAKTSENYTLYAYLLGLDGRCNLDKKRLDQALIYLETALKQNPANSKALGFVTKTVIGLNKKANRSGPIDSVMFKKASKSIFTRFKPQYETYLAIDPVKRDNELSERIQKGYQSMVTQ